MPAPCGVVAQADSNTAQEAVERMGTNVRAFMSGSLLSFVSEHASARCFAEYEFVTAFAVKL
jgi:hypothetical protein